MQRCVLSTWGSGCPHNLKGDHYVVVLRDAGVEFQDRGRKHFPSVLSVCLLTTTPTPPPPSQSLQRESSGFLQLQQHSQPGVFRSPPSSPTSLPGWLGWPGDTLVIPTLLPLPWLFTFLQSPIHLLLEV